MNQLLKWLGKYITIPAILIIAGVVAFQVMMARIDAKDRRIAELQEKLAAAKPDTVIIQGDVDTVFQQVKIAVYETIKVAGTTKIDTIYKDGNQIADITVKGSTTKKFPAGIVSAGCVAHYPSGRMDFTIGMTENKHRQGFCGGLDWTIGRGTIKIGGDVTYRSKWAPRIDLQIKDGGETWMFGVRRNF